MEPIPFLSLASQHEVLANDLVSDFEQLLSGNQFILGTRLQDFEAKFASYTGSKFCFGVGNGLDALTLALQSLRLSPLDEVLVPAHTYVATWHAIARANLRIVPVDADPHTFNIDPTNLDSHCTPNTKVILPVHMYGQACNMSAIGFFAGNHELCIVEDNAQAHGSSWLTQRTGNFGAINATSFYPTKNLGALGDGGAITTNDSDLAQFIRRNRNYGMESKNHTVDIGLNSRLDEIQAAVLTRKLDFLDRWNDMRREIARIYLEELKGVGDLTLPLSDKEAHHVYHLFVVRTSLRDELKTYLEKNGIGTMVHYPTPPHLQPAYSDLNFKKGQFPVAESIAATALSLPMWPGLSDHQIEYVIRTIKAFY